MSTDRSSDIERLATPANTRLAILATPVFSGQLDIDFARSNFFMNAPPKPKGPDSKSWQPPETIKIDTSPHTLFRQVLKSMHEPFDPELEAVLEERSRQYANMIAAGQHTEVEEMVASTVPLNSAISQAFVVLRDFLDAKYDRIFETTVDVAEVFGKFVVAQSVIEDRH